MHPGDLVVSDHDECSLTSKILTYEDHTYSWGSFLTRSDIPIYDGMPAIVIATMLTLRHKTGEGTVEEVLAYLLCPIAIGWDYAKFYRDV